MYKADFWATVTRPICYGTVVPSLCNVGVLCPTVGWIKIRYHVYLAWRYGLGPGHIVLDGDRAFPSHSGYYI